MVYVKENYNFPRFKGVSKIFRGRGSNFFQGGGVHLLITMETHKMWFSRRGSGRPQPLDPRMMERAGL